MYYTMYMPGACRGQKKLSDLLKLELQTAVGCSVGAGNHQNLGPLEEQRVLSLPVSVHSPSPGVSGL